MPMALRIVPTLLKQVSLSLFAVVKPRKTKLSRRLSRSRFSARDHLASDFQLVRIQEHLLDNQL